MKSPATITALHSMKSSHPNSGSQQHRYAARLSQMPPLPQMPQLSMSNSSRRLGLWMAGITLGLVAVWLMVTSVNTHWQIGICIAGAWMATIIFNLYSLNYLAGQATALKRKETPKKRAPRKSLQRHPQPAFNFGQQVSR